MCIDPPLPPQEPVALPMSSGHHLGEVAALGHEVAVTAVGRDVM